MIYVMSDIHGCYKEYIKMLELINFNDSDILYIIGDICDRGNNPMDILLHMMNHENIIPIYGNHDIEAYPFLVLEYNNQMNYYDRKFLWWLSQGGNTTLADFQKLSQKNQRKVLSYLEEFKYYEELTVNNTNYILVHGGLKDFDPNESLDEYDLYDLVWERPDYDKIYFEDKYIISGHTPTIHIDREMKGKIMNRNHHIVIDCGCVFGYGLGCLCLDTMEEYYINSEE